MQTTKQKHLALLADYCASNGINKIVLSPGSRNAPLIIAFESHPNIETYLIHDERAAAFFALGIADKTNNPVAIVCTSGSALLNYAPAVVEAYYRKVPLFILSADRPVELIDQGDGQTMRQQGVYRNYVKSSFQLPNHDARNQFEKSESVFNRAIQDLLTVPQGPVHINIPLAEPLYETMEHEPDLSYSVDIQDSAIQDNNIQELLEIWNGANKKMILIGQLKPSPALQQVIDQLIQDPSVAILTENTSNIQGFVKVCHSIDRTLASISEEELEDFIPDLIVSIGGAIISKRIKRLLREHKARYTWRVGLHPIQEDTFQSLTHSIKLEPELLLNQLVKQDHGSNSNYGGKWKQKDLLSHLQHENYLSAIGFSDLKVFEIVLDSIPENAVLHMANSSVVRYCQLFNPVKSIKYFANRGVSGIDGSSSTAAGYSSIDKDELNVLITGDISFFYDSNAFWNKVLTDNLKVIVINNGGGGIFEYIPGPSTSAQAETFFAPTGASIQGICQAYDVNYCKVNTENELVEVLQEFFQPTENARPAVLEVDTRERNNAEILKEYFRQIESSAV